MYKLIKFVIKIIYFEWIYTYLYQILDKMIN